MEDLSIPGVVPLDRQEQQDTDGGCWICWIWGPPTLKDPTVGDCGQTEVLPRTAA